MDEVALVCDLAETYHVYEYRSFRPSLVAAFFDGLGADSRIKMRISGQKVERGIYLLAVIADYLATLCWMQSKDGARGVNRPQRITDIWYGEHDAEDDAVVFGSPEEFMEMRGKLLKKGGNPDGGS